MLQFGLPGTPIFVGVTTSIGLVGTGVDVGFGVAVGVGVGARVGVAVGANVGVGVGARVGIAVGARVDVGAMPEFGNPLLA